MKVTVFGAGAIGSMFGGLLKHHAPDVDVLLIGRGAHGQAISERGYVVLEGPWGKHQVPIRLSTNAADVAGSDLVLLTVKSHVTRDALADIGPHLGDAIVVSIQNGINHRVLSEAISPDRLVMGMTPTNMAILEPGTVSLQVDNPTRLGACPGSSSDAAAQQAVEVLNRSGMKFELHPNILGVQYNKLAFNAVGYASALSGSDYVGQCLLYRPWRDAVGIPLLDECLRVFDAAGIQLANNPGLSDVRRLRRMRPVFDRKLIVAGFKFIGKLTGRKPIVFSLYLDLKHGKTTEIEHINGQLVALAHEHGTEAPLNAKVVELVHRLETRGDGSIYTREEVIDEFNALHRTRELQGQAG